MKKLLYEVSIIRPIIIFLLVLLHSFTKISEGGRWVSDYQLAGVYQWFVWLISGFRIETIALVAGYVFSYQSNDLGKKYDFIPFVWKKFKRLIIPMLAFGIVYYFCFYFQKDTFTIQSFLISIFSGCGHLWFLPMLFWCFIVIWLIDYLKISSFLLLLFLALISIIPTPTLPLGFARLSHFIFYVYGGYYLWTKRDLVYKHCLTIKWIIALWLLYVALVFVCHALMPVTTGSTIFWEKLLFSCGFHTVELLMAIFGILALYITVSKITSREDFRPKQWIIKASDNCYGVYVYHQFILVWLYFCTPFVKVCHPLIIPWIGFAISLSLSLIFTKLSLKTKFGRFLIG